MPTYEVFLKKPGRDPFSHAGSLDASDDEMALMFARECYCRRSEGAQMWVVKRAEILVADEQELDVADKPHRHNDGAVLSDLRGPAAGEEDDEAPGDEAPADG